MRDSAVFYRSFYEAIKDLPPENQAEVYTAIFEYAFDFKEPELSGISKTIFTLIKPQIQANIKRFKNGSKARQKQSISRKEANDKQNESKRAANNNVNNNTNLNEKENLNENSNMNENVNALAEDSLPHPLEQFVKKLKEVSKFKTPLTVENCKALLNDYGEEYIKEILLAMENTKGIANKYTSVYLTVRRWIEVRKSNTRITDPGAAQLKRPFKPITPDQL